MLVEGVQTAPACMLKANASLNWHSSGSVCIQPQTDQYIVVALHDDRRCPGWTIWGSGAPGQTIQGSRRHRVDRRRRLRLPELYTSPRLKRRDTSWQQVAWRMIA